ncbi:hypothetical protein [Sphingomonas mucosissima]|uniref:Class I SAM-dependent methyltransferase n=1 Tax=Sphingomonas mucosissima TaxID=370959 RepID=A0A245ZT95_9SPHN|nr:hypothetical protein [Sphingomonas mucosissima]OWK32930.1 hypothetical protein SPMU_12730 [Sphingomonas mucosissima]
MTAQTLDPFGYWPAQRSRIRSLGGDEKGDDPSYVFHTSYVSAPAGPSVAAISFHGLVAEAGMIAVRIFQHLPEGKSAITEQGKLTALLPSLAKAPRVLKLPFEALPGALYAVTGYAYGECEASARDIVISISSRQGERDDPARTRSLFGRFKARRANGMVSGNAPQLAWPVSQGFTPDQTLEPDFNRLSTRLSPEGSMVDRWESAYILRVLEQYGRLEPGARGLALSAEPEPVAAAAVGAGCDVRSVITPVGATVDAICSEHFTPPDGIGFDFIYARSSVFGTGDPARALKMIDDMLARIRPGGLAVLLLNTGPGLDRHGLGRIALEVAAQGHFTAQLRYGDPEEGSVPFGIVIRTSTENVVT